MITLPSGLSIVNKNFSLVLSHRVPARVIISVPHDGFIRNDFSLMCAVRSRGVLGRDAHVWPIVNDMVHRGLTQSLRIDAVRFLLPRAYVDANREHPKSENLDPDTQGQTAFDDVLLSPVYAHYHRLIARLIERSINAYGAECVLFIDMHGFGKQPRIAPPNGFDLILGTANRATIQRGGNIDQFFAEFLSARGYCVYLPSEIPREGGDPYNAGHTTRFYAHRYGIDAFQIEIAKKFRERDSQAIGEALAFDIVSALAHYR